MSSLPSFLYTHYRIEIYDITNGQNNRDDFDFDFEYVL